MQKRRERIERWRAERKKKEQEALKKEASKSSNSAPQCALKKWSLEDDSEDEDKANDKAVKDDPESHSCEKPEVKKEKVKQEDEDDIDPLDEYMKSVQDEVRQINKFDVKKGLKTETGSKKGEMVIVTGVAKAKESKNKGELIEQNQDGLEYSSEEEQEDLKDTAANIANKQKKELAKIDHNEIRYAPFRKNFYVEVPEIAKMTHEEVEAYKEELEGIRVKGK